MSSTTSTTPVNAPKRKRGPSVVTQLKNLRVEHAAVQQEVTKLQKEAERAASTHAYVNKAKEVAEAELAQMHALLDALPNAIPRKPESADGYVQPHPCSTRLSAWLAVRSTM